VRDCKRSRYDDEVANDYSSSHNNDFSTASSSDYQPANPSPLRNDWNSSNFDFSLLAAPPSPIFPRESTTPSPPPIPAYKHSFNFASGGEIKRNSPRIILGHTFNLSMDRQKYELVLITGFDETSAYAEVNQNTPSIHSDVFTSNRLPYHTHPSSRSEDDQFWTEEKDLI
jgi:hypothetical protein